MVISVELRAYIHWDKYVYMSIHIGTVFEKKKKKGRRLIPPIIIARRPKKIMTIKTRNTLLIHLHFSLCI